jgi:prepilin-type N-terminal cleavage/methylation domain-containing protein
MNGRNGFSLLEVVLAIGISAVAATFFAGLLNIQARFAAQNRDLAEGMEILDDFCTFVDTSSFGDMKTLADGRTIFCVTENSEDGIVYRKFVPKNDWELVHGREYLGYTVEIEQMEALFADEDARARCYIPMLCRICKWDGESRIPASDANFPTFVAVKNY